MQVRTCELVEYILRWLLWSPFCLSCWPGFNAVWDTWLSKVHTSQLHLIERSEQVQIRIFVLSSTCEVSIGWRLMEFHKNAGLDKYKYRERASGRVCPVVLPVQLDLCRRWFCSYIPVSTFDLWHPATKIRWGIDEGVDEVSKTKRCKCKRALGFVPLWAS